MANRRADVTLSETVSSNLKRVCADFDVSTRDLASRLEDGAGQKSIWNLLNNQHSPTLKTLEPVCRALMVSPAALMVPGIPTSLLVSRRLNRLIETYSQLTSSQRDDLEDVIKEMAAKNS
jgi:transcriptional regulator with XRE-family HTH domain